MQWVKPTNSLIGQILAYLLKTTLHENLKGHKLVIDSSSSVAH